MISQLEKKIAFRYLKTRKKDGFLNVISIFSFIGISLGVAVLIIVMSVMNGFRSELVNKIVGFNSHITVKPYENKILLSNINQNLQRISKDLILSNSGEAIIINNKRSKGVLLRGYKSEDFSKLKIFNDGIFLTGRDDLFKKELEEIKIIEEFLPKHLSEDEVIKIIEDLISQNNISDISGMGLIMSELKKKYSGQLDLGLASKIIKDRINS